MRKRLRIMPAGTSWTSKSRALSSPLWAEGDSIRSLEGLSSIHRDTSMRLMVRVGEGCSILMDEMMRGLTGARLQLDELWAFVG